MTLPKARVVSDGLSSIFIAIHKVDVRPQTATICRWRLRLDCSRSSELNGSYLASKSAAEISVLGQ